MTDRISGLQIRSCADGQSWGAGRCSGTANAYKWDEAVQRFGQNEWRLATKEEASQLAPDGSKRCGFGPTWTSSLYNGDTKWAVGVGIQNDVVVQETFQRGVAVLPVQLVRSGQTANRSHNSSEKITDEAPFTDQKQQQSVQNRQAQQQSQQAQQTAQQTQSRADQQRQGKRKTHDPAAEAHECISIDKSGSGNFGAFKNQCPYQVNFYSCNEKPRIIQGGFNWSADFDCAKQQLGLYTPRGNSSVAAHNRNTEFVHWYACKAPATPVDATYAPGKGIEARCHN